MSKISLEQFVNETKGKQVAVPWGYAGQCVSLVQQFINQCYEQPMEARGNAVDWINTYPAQGLGTIVESPRKGDLLVFPNEADGYGHIAIYVGEETIYDQNNFRHDNGLAGYGTIFSNDYITLRPNAELIEDKPLTQTLVLPASADTWRVYPMDVAPVIGNECGMILPSKFGGLEYEIKGWTMDNVAIIDTRDFGRVQIYVAPNTGAIIK